VVVATISALFVRTTS